MTVFEALTVTELQHPSDFPEELQLRWLSDLDGKLFREVLLTHADPPVTEFHGYGAETQGTAELLLPDPWSELYPAYLAMQADLHSGDIASYNNSAAVYNAMLRMFLNHYNRTHLPLGAEKLKF